MQNRYVTAERVTKHGTLEFRPECIEVDINGDEVSRRWLHDTWDLDYAQCHQVITTSAELNRQVHITQNTVTA